MWAMWMFAAALVTILVTAAGTLMIWRQVKLTRKAVAETAKATAAMELQNTLAAGAQRAWIKLSIEPRVVRGLGDGRVLFRTDLVATNIGQTVARNFELNTEVLFKGQSEDTDAFNDRIQAILDKWRADYDRPSSASLVPQDSETDSFEGEQASSTLKWWSGGGWPVRATQPIFLLAAFYRTASDDAILHVTWRTWYLGHRDQRGIFRPHIHEHLGPLEPPVICANPYHTTLMHEEFEYPD